MIFPNFRTAEISSYFFQRSLRCGKADALNRLSYQVLQAFYRQGQMRAALGGDQCMNFVDDNNLNRPERVAGV